MKLLTIVGARPQFIKAATVSREIILHGGLNEVLVHTGQHHDANMSDIFFNDLEIPRPRHNLGISGGGHGVMTGRMLEAIEAVILEEKPDFVLVYGDTNSTLAGALAAVKLRIPIAHVEAGLRSFNRAMPEEINRVLTDHASDVLFAPTEAALANLSVEGLSQERLHLVGDVMYDAALYYRGRARPPQWFSASGLREGEFVLATVHRAENTDDPNRLRGILSGLGASGRPVILPLHPRTRARMVSSDISPATNIRLVDPVGYLEMVWLEVNAALIATDSGGVQKEAYFHAKRCLTLRDETEWVELVENGWNRLVGTNADQIVEAIVKMQEPATCRPLYGSGNAARKIVELLA